MGLRHFLSPLFFRSIQQSRHFRKHNYPVTFEYVLFPPNGQMKLPVMLKEPVYDETKGEVQYKTTRRYIESRGPEEVHTELIHKQFGIAAVSGGQLAPNHLDLIVDRVNKNLLKNQFAVWRIEEPWLPVTKKPQGKMGGGKGRINRYVTPVRAGRLIVEVGGHIIEPEALSFLGYLADMLPFQARFVSFALLEGENREAERIHLENVNPFSWETVMRFNMQNCSGWLSSYDMKWRGKYK